MKHIKLILGLAVLALFGSAQTNASVYVENPIDSGIIMVVHYDEIYHTYDNWNGELSEIVTPDYVVILYPGDYIAVGDTYWAYKSREFIVDGYFDVWEWTTYEVWNIVEEPL